MYNPTARDRTILAADVGGTKTLLLLRLIDRRGEVSELAQAHYQSADYPSLEKMAQHFLQQHGNKAVDSACFAVAGPVLQHDGWQSARLTNLPWQLDSRSMGEELSIPRVDLLNDFQAIGYSLDVLADDDLVTLHQAEADPRRPRLLVGAGTGLGVGLLYPDEDGYISYPSEGGHTAFAPADEQQQALLEFLQQELPRVSYERLLSGNGLINIYRFLLQREGNQRSALLEENDPAAAIGRHGVDNSDELAAEAVALFCRIYGAFTGDLALIALAGGGVYIAGGIAPKLLPRLREGAFMAAYADKGRMRELVRDFPVHVITNPNCGLLGAAHYAART